MRALYKGDEPPVLRDQGAEWTQQYMTQRVNDPNVRGHWGHDEIRSELAIETSGKCAYCEAYVPHVAYENVEHMRPKATFPELAHAWDNLTSACPRCNVNKGSYYDPHQPILNPYVDDPADHLAFHGNLIMHRSPRGEVTWRKLKLERLDLANARLVRLQSVRDAFLRWSDSEQPLRGVLEEAIIDDAAQGEFTAAVRALLKTLGFPLPL